MALAPTLRRRGQRWLFFSTMACLSVSAVAWTSYSYWKWKRVDQIPDIGDPFDIAAWLPPELADDDNAAVVYRRAFALVNSAIVPLPDGSPFWSEDGKPRVADPDQFLQITA